MPLKLKIPGLDEVRGFGKLAAKLKLPESTARKYLNGELKPVEVRIVQGKAVQIYLGAQVAMARAIIKRNKPKK